MPVGLRVRDPNTLRVMFDNTTQTGNLLASLNIGGSGAAQDGSYTSALFGVGTPFFFVASGPIAFPRYQTYPSFWFDGTTFRWHFPHSTDRPQLRLLLGVMPGVAEYPPITGPRLIIRNENRRIQFMTGGITFQLVNKGTVYTTTDVKVGNTGRSSVLIPAQDPSGSTRLIAIRSPNFTTARWTHMQRNGQWYAVYSCDTAETGQPVEYWTFELASNLSGGSVGLRMKDPASLNIIYNSNYDSLKIIDIPSINADIDTFYVNVSYPNGRKYATIAPAIAGYNQSTEKLYVDGRPELGDDGSSSYHNYSRDNDGKLFGTRVEDGTIRVAPVSFDDVIVQAPGYAQHPDPATVWWNNPLQNLLVIDVTDL